LNVLRLDASVYEARTAMAFNLRRKNLEIFQRCAVGYY
jgi:hypothetical protein